MYAGPTRNFVMSAASKLLIALYRSRLAVISTVASERTNYVRWTDADSPDGFCIRAFTSAVPMQIAVVSIAASDPTTDVC